HTRFSRDWSSDVCSSDLKSGCVQVLEQNERVVAYAVNTLIAGEAELLMIAVDPNQQGRGYGRALMNHLQQQLQQQGAEQWFLDEIGRASCRDRGWSAVGA